MSEKPQVIFTFKKDGQLQIEVVGVKGQGCLALTDSIRDKLASCQVTEKPEINEAHTDNTIRTGLGHG